MTSGLVIRVARCANAACTVIASDNVVVSGSAVNPSVVVLGNNRPMVAYYDINGALRVATCANAACTGTAAVVTVPGGNVGQSLAMTIAPNGRVWIAFYDGGAARDLYVLGCNGSDCSGLGLGVLGPQLLDSAGDVGNFVSIAVGADNRPVIAYRETTANGRLKVAKCGPPAFNSGGIESTFCSTPSIAVADSLAGRDMGFFTSIAVPADGNPVVSHHDGTVGSQLLRFVKCANFACTANTAVRNIDATVGVGGFSTIAVPSDNLPVIAYIDDPQGALKFAKCRTASCGESAIITTLDDNAGAEDTGWEARMVLGRDGLPLVVYQDLLSRQVRAVKCGSRSCQ